MLQPCPTAPTWLDDDARREWDALIPHLWEAGRLDPAVDVPGLTALVASIATWRKAEELLNAEGLVLGGKTHPAVKIARDAKAEMLAWSKEYGMTSQSRARLGEAQSAKSTKEEDEAREFFGY